MPGGGQVLTPTLKWGPRHDRRRPEKERRKRVKGVAATESPNPTPPYLVYPNETPNRQNMENRPTGRKKGYDQTSERRCQLGARRGVFWGVGTAELFLARLEDRTITRPKKGSPKGGIPGGDRRLHLHALSEFFLSEITV